MFKRDELLEKIIEDQRALVKYILRKEKITIDSDIFSSKHPPYLLLKRLEKKGKRFSEEEICRAILMDTLYSPIATIVQEIRGRFYEDLIEKWLKNIGVKYRRGMKNKKHPDFLLETSIKIDGENVNWIESKFFYADEDIHKYFKKKQYESYKKYGKGLIVYWLGFNVKDDEFIIKDYKLFYKEFPHIKIYDIGYIDKGIDEFIDILKKYNIKALIDVRRYPRSKIEHYNKDRLEKILKRHNISYYWIENLGGFRGRYERYMLTMNFINGILELLNIIKREKNVVIMCREKNYKYCHRKYILSVLENYFKIIHL